MNIQDYISSGIVESYVLGLADDSERVEFEKLCRQYPELVQAREQFEEMLEKHALANAVAPAAGIKRKVMAGIQEASAQTPQKIRVMDTTTAPVQGTPRVRSMNGWRYVAAASIILLAVSAWLAYSTNQKNNDLADRLRQLQVETDSARAVARRIVDEQNAKVSSEAILVNMRGTEKAPGSSASIFWDSAAANVYLVVQNMPQLPNDKQYQLWAIIDGAPKDLGVFDVKKDNFIVKMQGVRKAQAFAITIEKKGGSPTPTLDNMQVMGETKRGL